MPVGRFFSVPDALGGSGCADQTIGVGIVGETRPPISVKNMVPLLPNLIDPRNKRVQLPPRSSFALLLIQQLIHDLLTVAEIRLLDPLE